MALSSCEHLPALLGLLCLLIGVSSCMQECENTARQAQAMLGCIGGRFVGGVAAAAAGSQVNRGSLEDNLRRVPGGHPVLREIFPDGIAFHYSTLETEEKRVVETAFRIGVVRVLVATSTLAAGVNLPAARVILRWALPRSADCV